VIGGPPAERGAAPRAGADTGLPAAPASYDSSLERVEVDLLLEGVYRHYGFDFRGYAYASLRRRIWKRIHADGLPSVSALQAAVLHDPAALERLLDDLSVNVTAMFRDPGFWAAFRTRVVPVLRTYPFFRIWHAGCSTGEEVYAMAILLEEEGLYDRARVYATDMNERVLRQARGRHLPARPDEGVHGELPAGRRRAGVLGVLHGRVRRRALQPALLRNVVFAQHNLVTDRSFSEFNAILCRNVLIYFDKALQARVHRLCYDSLAMFGVLALGGRETLRFSAHEECFERWRRRRRSTGRCGDRVARDARARRARSRPAGRSSSSARRGAGCTR
jgi:chemotaxis protein methyltransferase CheR